MTYIADNFTQFNTDETTNFTNCSTAVQTAYNLAYLDATPTPSIGVQQDVLNAYTECEEEMENFHLKIVEVANEMRAEYVKEAQVQQHLAKTDFLTLISATLKKIHDVNDLTELEKDELMQALVDKRTEFGTAVMAYITAVGDETETIVLELNTKIQDLRNDFEDEVSTKDGQKMICDALLKCCESQNDQV